MLHFFIELHLLTTQLSSTAPTLSCLPAYLTTYLPRQNQSTNLRPDYYPSKILNNSIPRTPSSQHPKLHYVISMSTKPRLGRFNWPCTFLLVKNCSLDKTFQTWDKPGKWCASEKTFRVFKKTSYCPTSKLK